MSPLFHAPRDWDAPGGVHYGPQKLLLLVRRSFKGIWLTLEERVQLSGNSTTRQPGLLVDRMCLLLLSVV
jgi:hypothetical protein